MKKTNYMNSNGTIKNYDEIKDVIGKDNFLVITMYMDGDKLMEVSFMAEKKFIGTEDKFLEYYFRSATSLVKKSK